ncbi:MULTISPECIES: TIGR02594 family protein [unclassified Rhizobium]|uniref:TIGR02594 family protein n=1 Tax=unclassified Rhizobium TaxID=2613769 RepID=UPI000ABC9249|nr:MULTISPECIES: TIGR02594 family protein [unclassified Rhizobium]
MTRVIIDTPYSVKTRAKALAIGGTRCVIRYYNRKNSQTFPDKCLTRAEAEAISDAGMTMAVVFQQNHRQLSDFLNDNAEDDAKRALECAAAVGQPKESAIYVSVDHDFYRADELGVIESYFEHVARAFRAAGYKIGVYGSGTVGARLKKAGLVDYVWLARALGWSGSRDALRAGSYDLYQDAIDLKIDGLDCDSNITRPGQPDFGQFTLSEVEPERRVQLMDVDAGRTLYEVASRSSLNLRGGPSLDYPVIRSLSPGMRVYGLQRSGDWLKVDLEGDGKADGYVWLNYMRSIAGHTANLPVQGQQAIDIAYRELALQVREVPGPASNPRISLYYRSMDGSSADLDDSEVSWCSYFANFCFAELGQQGSGKSNARSWTTWGRPVLGPPQKGNVVVLWRESISSWKGHVGFFVGYDGDNWLLIGGNQDDAVSIKAFDPARVLAVRRL